MVGGVVGIGTSRRTALESVPVQFRIRLVSGVAE